MITNAPTKTPDGDFVKERLLSLFPWFSVQVIFFSPQQLSALFEQPVKRDHRVRGIRKAYGPQFNHDSVKLPACGIHFNDDVNKRALPIAVCQNGEFEIGDEKSIIASTRLSFDKNSKQQTVRVDFPTREWFLKIQKLNEEFFSTVDSRRSAAYVEPAETIAELREHFPFDCFHSSKHQGFQRLYFWRALSTLLFRFRTDGFVHDANQEQVAFENETWWVPCIHRRNIYLPACYARCEVKGRADAIGIAYGRNLSKKSLADLHARMCAEFNTWYLF